MSKERIGKHERWILTHCYLKDKGILTKDEIMIEHFGLEESDHYGRFRGLGKHSDHGNHYDFDNERKRNNAMVSFTGAKKSLLDKGFIKVDEESYTRPSLCVIRLTEKGNIKAEKILNLNYKSIIKVKESDSLHKKDSQGAGSWWCNKKIY